MRSRRQASSLKIKKHQLLSQFCPFCLFGDTSGKGDQGQTPMSPVMHLFCNCIIHPLCKEKILTAIHSFIWYNL